MHRVTVKDVQFSKVGFVMLLESQLDQRVLPVFIAPGEAQAILVRLKGIESKRPLTHDLMRQFLVDLGVEVRRVVIHALDESTDIFYATILYAKDGTIRDIDARPSDAVALALRCDAPIWVDPSVMDKAGVEPGRVRAVEPAAEEAPAQPPEPPPVTEADMISSLEDRLRQAIRDERYEDAARLRDQIDELRHTADK
ncbi:MAG: bifunctional nuclease family protein [Lentisphaeria bacterium]|jgi:bifunctional DNase/RNase|nr:bifunctional nuclease family protein [Lentisphaeria bacterium]